jgi:hypothetical protein
VSETQVTSGARRGCGTREPGGAYLAVPLGPDGKPIEHFLIDPPFVVDANALGLAPVGTTMIERDEVTHVLDVVGREHYPTVAEFIEEATRLGVSRRISGTADFSRLGPRSRLLLLHAHADIANAPQFASTRRCPSELPEHLAEGFNGMCARLWLDEPLEAAEHRLAIFASFPVVQIEVVRDPDGGSHAQTIETASNADVPVVEVDR